MDIDEVAFPELGVAPLIASGTDLEDELPLLEAPQFREASSPRRECSPLLRAPPVGADDGPIPSQISPSLRMADVLGPSLPCMAPMDQYLPWIDAPFGWGVVGLSLSASTFDSSAAC